MPAEGGADKVAPAANKVSVPAAPAENKVSRQEVSQAMAARIAELQGILGRASGGWGVSQILRSEACNAPGDAGGECAGGGCGEVGWFSAGSWLAAGCSFGSGSVSGC